MANVPPAFSGETGVNTRIVNSSVVSVTDEAADVGASVVAAKWLRRDCVVTDRSQFDSG